MSDFTSKLATDVEMKFPEATLKSAKDFSDWYAKILAKYAKATHDITGLTVWPENSHWRVEIDLRWQATKVSGGEDALHVHQSWELIPEPSGLRIHRYSVTPL